MEAEQEKFLKIQHLFLSGNKIRKYQRFSLISFLYQLFIKCMFSKKKMPYFERISELIPLEELLPGLVF